MHMRIPTTRPASMTLLASILACVFAAGARAADLADVLGVAHVDGKYYLTKQDYLDEGMEAGVLTTGSRTIRLYLNASAIKRYSWNSTWPAEFKNLVEIARSPYFQSVFSKPFHTYILTTYALGRDDHYWNQGISAEQEADESRQFYDLAKYLLTTYRGTGKTFVLQHWEGDWALRDMGPEGHRHTYEKDFTPTPTAIDGMIKWLNARQAGINRAHERNFTLAATCTSTGASPKPIGWKMRSPESPRLLTRCCRIQRSIWSPTPATTFWIHRSIWPRVLNISPPISPPPPSSDKPPAASISANTVIRKTAIAARSVSTTV